MAIKRRSLRRTGEVREPALDHFGILAPIYDRIFTPPKVDVLRELLELAPHHMLLDVGGGTGRAAKVFVPYVASISILDVSFDMLRQTPSKAGMMPCAGMSEHLPFASASFDRMMAVDSFHHFRNHRRAAQELARVLRPGGRMVIEEPDIRRWLGKAIALFETVTLMRSRLHDPHELRACFADTGVTTTEYTNGGFTFWIIVDKPATPAVMRP